MTGDGAGNMSLVRNARPTPPETSFRRKPESRSNAMPDGSTPWPGYREIPSRLNIAAEVLERPVGQGFRGTGPPFCGTADPGATGISSHG